MKIVCVAYLHGRGGAERQIVMLANALAKFGHEVYLLSLAVCNPVYALSSDVHFIDLSKKEKKFPKTIIRYISLRKELMNIRPDVSIHFWMQSAYLCTLMPKSVCGKIVYAERGDPGDKEYAFVLGVIRWLSFKRIDGFVFQSKGARDYFNIRIRNRSIVIPNSHSIPDSFLTEPCVEREKIIISVGRLHPQKNHALMIKAFARIANEISDYNLEIYGDGPLKDSLNKLVDSLGMGRRVSIYPSCSDIFEKMYKSSLFVLTSDYEGMPNALMEAMAIGVPCISTDCKPGGARELIENAVNGWIVPCNDVEALSDKIKFVLNECADLKLIVKNALMIRVVFSGEKIYDCWSRFVKKIYMGDYD